MSTRIPVAHDCPVRRSDRQSDDKTERYCREWCGVLSETVFRSEDLPVADRFDAWPAFMARTHAPLDISSDHSADFHAHQRLIRLGEISVWPATFHELIFRRTPTLIRQSDPEFYHLGLFLQGEGEVSWDRQQAS